MDQSTSTLTFNTLFNSLHKLITTLLDTSEKREFYYCLTDIRERGEQSVLFERIDSLYGDDLRTINSIRNILIHKNDWITIPKSTISTLQNIIDGIMQLEKNFHTQAIDVFGKKIFVARDTDKLATVTEAIAMRNFSHVPVYTEEWKFRGVFSLKSLVYWVNKGKKGLDTNILIKDIPIDTKSSEYLFIKSTTKVSEIEGYFLKYSKNRKKLGAIFLTPSGGPDTAIEGIITAWDLPMIYEQSGV